MNRREFVTQVVLFSAGFSLSVPRYCLSADTAVARFDPSPSLAVVTGSDYRAAVREAIGLLGGLQQFVKPGNRVVVKPNIGWDRSPEQGANTHPLVVQAIVELALQAGAKRVLVFDNTCNEQRRCYTNSGIAVALKGFARKGVDLDYIDTRKFVPVDISRGRSLSRWDIYQEALTADCYINVPVAKHHGLSRLSLGLKNSMGAIGGNRGRLHHDLGQKLADLATVIRPALTVIDATRILLRNGPQGGRAEDVQRLDTIIACADPVAADAYATTLFGLKPEDISATVAASRMGLGQIDLARINKKEKML